MVATDEDALICDLAETYGIFDHRSLPLRKLAVLSVGLRDDSRIKMRMCGMKVSTETLLLASIADRLGLLVWAQTEDGQKGQNRPVSLVSALTEERLDSQSDGSFGYDTPADFQTARDKILMEVVSNG